MYVCVCVGGGGGGVRLNFLWFPGGSLYLHLVRRGGGGHPTFG